MFSKQTIKEWQTRTEKGTVRKETRFAPSTFFYTEEMSLGIAAKERERGKHVLSVSLSSCI